MTYRIGFVISLAFFIFGAFGTYNDFETTYFSDPGEGGFILFIYIAYIAGATSSAYFLARMSGHSGKNSGRLVVLPIVFLIILTIIFAVVSIWIETTDLDKNGTVIRTTVDSTAFKWVKSGREQLYYNFSYRFRLNDSTYQFTQWRRIANHKFTSTKNPNVDYGLLSGRKLFHPGDTLQLQVSTVNPWRHRLLTEPKLRRR